MTEPKPKKYSAIYYDDQGRRHLEFIMAYDVESAWKLADNRYGKGNVVYIDCCERITT